jgi:hypothetical protein
LHILFRHAKKVFLPRKKNMLIRHDPKLATIVLRKIPVKLINLIISFIVNLFRHVSVVRDCKDVLDNHVTSHTGGGVYTVKINGQLTDVLCDMVTSGGGWTV